ncbi:hypothetical protein FHR32_007222 [Streptosporangium album]|uniref:Uncharacterized protein n=1 Tax=Streptosporangium album TaxID=47479 RepID=A0A7W7WCN9_9ACTN|nr:hypothetical protein [Streptosporangium album]
MADLAQSVARLASAVGSTARGHAATVADSGTPRVWAS